MQSTIFTPYQIVRQQYVRENIDIVQRVDGFTECWEWRDRNHLGYGKSTGAQKGDKSYGKAYRTSYLAFVGPIPPRLQLDHLCVNRPCVNPEHLEPVTQRENVQRAVKHHQARGTGNWNKLDVCTKGLHAMTDDNIYLQKVRQHIKRSCRECVRERQRKFWAENPDKVAQYQATRKAKLQAQRRDA